MNAFLLLLALTPSPQPGAYYAGDNYGIAVHKMGDGYSVHWYTNGEHLRYYGYLQRTSLTTWEETWWHVDSESCGSRGLWYVNGDGELCAFGYRLRRAD